MNTNITELVFILDRSGSMSGLESDTIGGFNAMLKTQQAQAGQARLTTVLFDNEYFLLHDRLDLNAVRPMTNEDYYVRGSTALLDAIGRESPGFPMQGCVPFRVADLNLDGTLEVVTVTRDGRVEAHRQGAAAVRVPLKHPMSDYFTATPRAGCRPATWSPTGSPKWSAA